MKKFIAFISLIIIYLSLPAKAFCADNVINPGDGNNAYIKDAGNNLLPLKVAYTTDGNGNLKVFVPGVSTIDDDVIVPPNSGKMYLKGADTKLYPATVFYTTDGNGSVLPIPINTYQSPLVYTASTAVVSIPEANDTTNGYLSMSDHYLFGKAPTITDAYYVDGDLGDDGLAVVWGGNIKFPFKTIQACLDYLGQPSGRIDALRHISIYISSRAALSGALFSGIYTENLTVPNRYITMYCAGCKIDGNILKEYSSSRRFGASSSEFRPVLTTVGLTEARDSHPRIRSGFHVGGSMRTSILHRLLDSIQGDGTNHVTVHVAPGQYTYPIYVTANYPTEPYIRIVVAGTTNYNGTYDITTKVDATHFIATRVSGTNANTATETAGNFFESDSAGASGITHDGSLINTYMQGAYTTDDGTVNGGDLTAGSETFFADGVRFFTGIKGRGILIQRMNNCLWSGTSTISSAASINNTSFNSPITMSTFTYSTDDMGFTNNKFAAAVPITVSSAGQTVRMDSMTYSSFLASGSTWVTNTPTIAFLNNTKGIGYTPSISGNWAAPAPTTASAALDRMSTLLKTLNGGVAIP